MREEGRKKEESRSKRRRARLEGLGFFPFGGFDFFSKSSSSSPDHLLKVVRARISRILILRRQPITEGDHNHITQLRNPPAEEIICRRVTAAGNESPAVELKNHRQLPRRMPPMRVEIRRVTAVDRRIRL
ncbi:hypothetical protein AAC387_Pa07g1939 [Persea americana]